MVKVQLYLVGRARDGLRTSVLDLLDEVLVALLGEAAALLRVEVHVVNIQRGSGQGLGISRERRANARLRIGAVLPRLEVHIDADLVILERNQGNRKTRVAAEPELQRDVERLVGRSLAGDARDGGLRRGAGGIERNTSRALHQGEVVGVADERVKGLHRAGLRRELGPDLHPVTILAVNALTTDFNLNLLDEAVADVVEPAETLDRRAEGRTRS